MFPRSLHCGAPVALGYPLPDNALIWKQLSSKDPRQHHTTGHPPPSQGSVWLHARKDLPGSFHLRKYWAPEPYTIHCAVSWVLAQTPETVQGSASPWGGPAPGRGRQEGGLAVIIQGAVGGLLLRGADHTHTLRVISRGHQYPCRAGSHQAQMREAHPITLLRPAPQKSWLWHPPRGHSDLSRENGHPRPQLVCFPGGSSFLKKCFY